MTAFLLFDFLHLGKARPTIALSGGGGASSRAATRSSGNFERIRARPSTQRATDTSSKVEKGALFKKKLLCLFVHRAHAYCIVLALHTKHTIILATMEDPQDPSQRQSAFLFFQEVALAAPPPGAVRRVKLDHCYCYARKQLFSVRTN